MQRSSPIVNIKAVLTNIFISTMCQMTMLNVVDVACIDELTDNYHPTLHFPSAL